MKRKCWIIAAATIAACIGLAFVIPALRPWRPGVTKENFDRVEIGMTRAQVEAIVGPPNVLDGFDVGWINDFGDEARFRFDAATRLKEKHWQAFPDGRTIVERLTDHLPWRERPKRVSPREIR